MKKIVCFGEVLWDIFTSGKKPGGAPMNVAFHLQKQGMESTLVSAVGNDASGAELLRYLEKNGLDTTFVQSHATLPTGTVNVVLDAQGKATYTINQPVAWDDIRFSPKLQNLVREADALVFGSLSSRSPTSGSTLTQLLEAAAFRVFDMNLRPPHVSTETMERLLERTDLLKINDDEFNYLKEVFKLAGDEHSVLSALSRQFAIPTICVTLGEKGASILHGNKFLTHPGFQVSVSDTVGSGDAFLASLLTGLLRNIPLAKTLARANALGALVATKVGANPSYTENEISRLLEG